MSTNGETADLMVREGIQITESALKLAGLGAKNLAALLIALANDNQKLAGKTNLKRLIHDGEELTIFSVKQEDLKGFQMEAKRYGVLFYKLKLNHGDIKATQGDTGHSQADMVTKVYAHILDEDRKVNAQKFESAFYANPDLRGVQAPAEPAPALDVQSIILQLQQSPELLSALTSLISNQGCK